MLAKEFHLRPHWILQNPVGEFSICLSEFSDKLAIFSEELHAGDEHRCCHIRFFDQYLTPGFDFEP
jgi:hypothetical protein